MSCQGFLYNAIIAKRQLAALGSTADFLVLVGFTAGCDPRPASPGVAADLALLERFGLIVFFLPRLVEGAKDSKMACGSGKKVKVGFAEMALLKTTPWSFTQYARGKQCM